MRYTTLLALLHIGVLAAPLGESSRGASPSFSSGQELTLSASSPTPRADRDEAVLYADVYAEKSRP